MNASDGRPYVDSDAAWRWPIDISRYDRAPSLSPAERRALKKLGDGVRRWHPDARAEVAQIGRLIRPLADCRAVLEVRGEHLERSAEAAVARMLQCCLIEGGSYWGWDADIWIRVLGANQRDFLAYHPPWTDKSARHYLIGTAYLLEGFTDLRRLGGFKRAGVAEKVFGREPIREALDTLEGVLRRWGYGHAASGSAFWRVVGEAMLANRSPRLRDLTPEVLDSLRATPGLPAEDHSLLFQLQRALAALGIGEMPVRPGPRPTPAEGVHPSWMGWVRRWESTSTLTPRTRSSVRRLLFKVGRWLADEHPEITEPGSWTRRTCAAYVAAVNTMGVGDYVQRSEGLGSRMGEPLSARSKDAYLGAVRQFFRDCQEWGWISGRFDPSRSLATPRSVTALIGPDPRVISDDVWAKLMWAGLHFGADDLPVGSNGRRFYPLELVRALAITWLFGGLRSDEIVRLRVGCVRWQREDVSVEGNPGKILGKDEVCLLDVPINKTGTAFTKPVDPVLGWAIESWERVRPPQPPLPDPRTGERVDLLFCYRAKRVAREHLNDAVIEALCRKAGVPREDARGRITSHRARSTIASQLYNAKEPMSLFELQQWLGHRSPATTQHYARLTPSKLAKAYVDADYFGRNVRVVDVLIDREAVKSGQAANGSPWQYFDLGHGYCTYDFFEQCPHRMACARCDFYAPKESSKVQLLEARENLRSMLRFIPLTEEEHAAVGKGAESIDHLLMRLADVPTPAGPTPRQLGQTSFVPVHEIAR